jgi:hypothetical protein
MNGAPPAQIPVYDEHDEDFSGLEEMDSLLPHGTVCCLMSNCLLSAVFCLLSAGSCLLPAIFSGLNEKDSFQPLSLQHCKMNDARALHINANQGTVHKLVHLHSTPICIHT